MVGDIEEKPDNFQLPNGRCNFLFQSGSYYFAVNRAISKMWFDDIAKVWCISTRSNIKNYESEIETFLEWIKPFIDQGSGNREMYAIVIYEGSDEPTIYYLREKDAPEEIPY